MEKESNYKSGIPLDKSGLEPSPLVIVGHILDFTPFLSLALLDIC